MRKNVNLVSWSALIEKAKTLGYNESETWDLFTNSLKRMEYIDKDTVVANHSYLPNLPIRVCEIIVSYMNDYQVKDVYVYED